MRCYKRRIFAGAICEQIYYRVSNGARTDRPRMPKQRTEAEKAAHRNSISRRLNARLVNANFVAGESMYCTLTFDTQHEIYEFPNAKVILRNYIRTITRAYPGARIMAYMGRGYKNERIHFHMIVHGVPREFLAAKWKYGAIKKIDVLREHNFYDGVDHGADFTGLANYCWEHWTPEQGGKRWMQTRTVKKPDAEAPTECVRTYSADRAPVPPKGYMLVESKETIFGYLYFKYVKIPENYNHRRARKRID